MNKLMMSMLLSSFAVAVMFQSASAQTVYVVGDNLGWTVPQNDAAAYTNWASGKQFMVGDILTFNFATNDHDVQQVQRDSYEACTSTNSIGNSITTGPANITLMSSGENYYICTFGSHCSAGQKLAINVSGTPATSPPSTITTPPAAPSPTSPEAACPPPESTNSPTASTTPGVVTDNVPDSSSPSLFASFFVLIFGIIIATCL